MKLLHPIVSLALAAFAVTSVAANGAHAADSTLPAVHIRIESAPDGHGFAVEFTAQVAAPAESVAQALSDPASYPAWVPRMKSVQAVSPTDPEPVDGARAFDSTMTLPWPVGDVHESVVARSESGNGVTRWRWQHVRGDMRRNEVEWTVTAIDPEHTEVRYQASLWFKGWLPMFLLRLAERQYAPWFIDCLERRAAALATAAVPPTNAAVNKTAPRSSL